MWLSAAADGRFSLSFYRRFCYHAAMGEKQICSNKKAFHEYFIEERFEAGMVLTGTEVKSLRMGKANLNDAFALVRNGEAYLHNLHIAPYDFGNRQNHDPERTRKLLLHKNEILRLFGKVREQGYTLIPLRLYFKEGKVKVELGLAKGKKLYDKREDLKKKDMKRDLAQAMKERHR
jgi:SsrA-binding protein